VLPFNGKTTYDQYTKFSSITETQRIECFGKYAAKIEVDGIKIINEGVLSSLFGKKLMVVNLRLLNTGEYAFISSTNIGGTFMSYHWVDVHGKVVIDGVRSAIPGVLMPGQSLQVDIISDFPKGSGEFYLKLSPVQEGCAWFYSVNPTISEALNFSIINQ
jgi:hypothetical protein